MLDFTDLLVYQLARFPIVHDDLPSVAEDETGLRYCGLHIPVVLNTSRLEAMRFDMTIERTVKCAKR